jgi:hypothetical protein
VSRVKPTKTEHGKRWNGGPAMTIATHETLVEVELLPHRLSGSSIVTPGRRWFIFACSDTDARDVGHALRALVRTVSDVTHLPHVLAALGFSEPDANNAIEQERTR